MEYKIPLFNLNFDEQEENAVVATIRSNWISTGPRCEEMEGLFAKMLGAKYAVSLSNCTTALHLAYVSAGIGAGDEVICPSLSFVATVNAIKYTGATPVFCDITAPDDLNISPVQIEKLITPKTKAIVVVHFAGFPCDMDAIMALAQKHQLKVIEDACHGPLSEYKGKKLGTIGDVGCFSFFSNKNISTGEGGILVTNDERIAARVRSLRSHGMTTMSYQRAKGHATAYDVVEIGYNYRMDDIRAAIAIVQFGKLEKDLEKRTQNRAFYLKELSALEDKIYVPFANSTELASNYICPIVLKNSTVEYRDAVREKIHAQGVQTSVHYPAIHRFSIYGDLPVNAPFTEYVADNEITLPMYASLSEVDIRFVVDVLKNSL